jgi:glutathione peroxidase-family protein
MRQPVVLVLVLLHALLCAAALASSEFHQLHAKTLENEDFDFSNLQGRVVVITNVASECVAARALRDALLTPNPCRCGYTDDNYEKLTALEDEYDGELAVLAFPCNQFGKQEPGSARKIREFGQWCLRVSVRLTPPGGPPT